MITLDTRTELILTIKIYDSSFIGNTDSVRISARKSSVI